MHVRSLSGGRLAAAGVVLAVGASAGLAHAATPDKGSVSATSPTVEWSGTLAESAVSYNAFANNPDAPCAPGACDSFALDVADGGSDLVLTIELDGVASDGSAADAGFRVTAPDGSTNFSGGASQPGKPYKLTIKKAAKGTYTLDAVDDFFGSPGDYKATATLGATKAAAPAPPAPAPPAAPASPATAGTSMRITTRSASARKVTKKRKLAIGLSANGGEVDNVKVTLKKGSKKVASGSLAKLVGNGKATLKLKRLKKGSYRLTATGTDSRGGGVSAAATLKVKK